MAIKLAVEVTVYVVAQPVHSVAESITIHLVIVYYNVFAVKHQEKRLTTFARRPFRIALVNSVYTVLKNFFAAALRVWLSCGLT